MKHVTLLLFTLWACTVIAQVKDYRAPLEIQGRLNEVSVSPDGKIWLTTAVGEVYYTGHIDSGWHRINLPGVEQNDFNLYNPHLERASFFNPDTGIITGYIYATPKPVTSGYYRTVDGGKSWQLLDYGGNSWIYAMCYNAAGQAWLGGLRQELYYSDDYGKSWRTIKIPFSKADRIYAIYMRNSTQGIIGSDGNELVITTDNWNTVKPVATPYDQHLYKETNRYDESRFHKTVLWGNYMVVKQSHGVYYTHTDTINWQPLGNGVINFELDESTGKLVAVTVNADVLLYTTPLAYEKFNEQKLPALPVDMKAVNGSLFVYTGGVYKVTPGIISGGALYTTDVKIDTPKHIREAKDFTWGVTGNNIYLRDKGTEDWYRVAALDFDVVSFLLYNDYEAILWDGQLNHRYSLDFNNVRPYEHRTPLLEFLQQPLTEVTVETGMQGCFAGTATVVSYTKSGDTTLSANGFYHLHSDGKKIAYKNKVSLNPLLQTLQAINTNPGRMPALAHYQITAKDIDDYHAMVNNAVKKKHAEFTGNNAKKAREFYMAVPAMLDTAGDKVLQHILTRPDAGWSTNTEWITVQLINAHADTMIAYTGTSWGLHPWNLPWTFYYKGRFFSCYDVNFSKFIGECMPDDFYGKQWFANASLIYTIAGELWKRKSGEE